MSVVDEDNMASNSAVLPPSQQSVKAYVDGGTATITGKTINLANNTLTGTTAQFNTALSDNDFTTLAGSETLTNKTLTSPILNTGISGTAFKDEDNMSSDSATAVASQQSIKAYVDTQVGLSDLDISDGSSTIAIDLNSETLGLLGGTGITSTASGNNVTMAIDSTVVTKTGTETLTNKTLTTPVISSISNTGTVTLPTASDTLVGKATTDTLTNKTVNLANNTLTGTTAQFNSSLSDGSFVTLTGTESLTNKTLSSPIISDPTINSGSGILAINLSDNPLEIKQSGINTVLELNKNTSTHGTVLQIEQQGTSYGTINTDISGSTKKLQINSVGEFIVRANNGELVETISSSGAGNGLVAINGNVTASNLGTISSQASNNVSITGGSISGLSLPTADTQASSKLYVDNAIAGMRTRIITKVATTGNVNLTNALENGDSIDGISLSTGDKILVKSQTDATENGIYICPNSGTASRDTNYDTVEELAGQMIVVQQGSTNADKIFLCTTDNSGSIGSVDIVFSQVTPANQGTVQSVGITQSGSEFTIGNTPITSTGNITLNVNRISATKIGANTNISDTEYGYLNGVTSNIQTQLDNSASLGDAISFAVALGS